MILEIVSFPVWKMAKINIIVSNEPGFTFSFLQTARNPSSAGYQEVKI